MSTTRRTHRGSRSSYSRQRGYGSLLLSSICSASASPPASLPAISVGVLVAAGFDGLAGFGSVCAVIIALGIIANSVPGVYSAALGFQVLGRYGKAVLRYRRAEPHLGRIQERARAHGEYLIFRRGEGFDWTRWEDKVYLPVGVAALVVFLVGWLGAVLGMSQVYYVGRLAELVGGSDIGLWVDCDFTLLVFTPLRRLGLKWLGK
ncbi:hypothetical protein DM02DRAFT_660459 [Periconia macrospinosa]|uniref:Uncharacterized protein n=1 Tax=Periconia macrospinosa TaxID=97972 RepID=A0A2V1DD95_9PLEO|nr:hypothetical protein DM02DRAFT_660459 [Periconia macrospinosa]